MRILGLDPGLRATGWGVIDSDGNRLSHVAHGTVRSDGKASLAERLSQLYHGITEVVAAYGPDAAAVEETFVNKNPKSTLKLGQARGAAICAALNCGLPVHEYAARQIKQALVGKGNADKHQVQHMVKILLNIQGELHVDAGDALGICLCHSHHQHTQQRLTRAGL